MRAPDSPPLGCPRVCLSNVYQPFIALRPPRNILGASSTSRGQDNDTSLPAGSGAYRVRRSGPRAFRVRRECLGASAEAYARRGDHSRSREQPGREGQGVFRSLVPEGREGSKGRVLPGGVGRIEVLLRLHQHGAGGILRDGHLNPGPDRPLARPQPDALLIRAAERIACGRRAERRNREARSGRNEEKPRGRDPARFLRLPACAGGARGQNPGPLVQGGGARGRPHQVRGGKS